eukprot:403368717
MSKYFKQNQVNKAISLQQHSQQNENLSNKQSNDFIQVDFSSIIADNPLAHHSIYAGTKKFNKTFTKMQHSVYNRQTCGYSSRYNCSRPSTKYLTIKPSTVTTNLTNYKQDFKSVQPEQVAVNIFQQINGVNMTNQKFQENNGVLWHCLQGAALSYIPSFAWHLANKKFGQMEKVPYI